MNEEENTAPESLEVDITIYDKESTEISVRQIAYGVSPIVTMEPRLEGERIAIQITSSMFDKEEIVDLFQLVAQATERMGSES